MLSRTKMPLISIIFCQLLLLTKIVQCLNNGLALTPPMGWMTWQRFRCTVDCQEYPDDCISEDLIKRTANKMVQDGYLTAGYNYIIIDDCWSTKERDPITQELVADPKRFPSGIQALAKYVSSKGLKLGIYLDFGTKTCAGYPGSLFHLKTDAETLAKWGIDYVKVDGCNSDPNIQAEGYEAFGRYLNQTGRPIVYSCSYPAYIDWMSKPNLLDWNRLKENCNLWRMFGDIEDYWGSLVSVIRLLESKNSSLVPAAGPGHWNDPDMLLIGNYGLSLDQARTQMALWAMLASPLIISADLSTVPEEMRLLLTNKNLIALNQDAAGKQAVFIKYLKSTCMLWRRELSSESEGYVIAVNNIGSGGGPVKLSLKLSTDFGLPLSQGLYKLVDLFTEETKATVKSDDSFEIRVNPNGVIIMKVQQTKWIHQTKFRSF